jgi:hypothetical protein
MPSALIDVAQARAFVINPLGRTNVNPIPLAQIADSPLACQTPVPTPCSTSMVESLTIRFVPAALATRAARSSRATRSGPELTRKIVSIPRNAVAIDRQCFSVVVRPHQCDCGNVVLFINISRINAAKEETVRAIVTYLRDRAALSVPTRYSIVRAAGKIRPKSTCLLIVRSGKMSKW